MEPITREWLKSVNLDRDIAISDKFSIWLLEGWNVEIEFEDSSGQAHFSGDSGTLDLPGVKTRDDVRNLFRFLGIEIDKPN